MKRWAMIGAVLAASAAGAQTMAAQGPDDAAIRSIAAEQEAAWNAHDIAAWVRPLAPDSQFVTAFGLWWTSRDETERKMGYAFRMMFAQSRMHVDQVAVTSLTPDVAVAHLALTLDNAKGPDGSDVGTVHLMQSQTLRKTAGAWQIASVQDTAVIGQLPTTTRPVAASPASPASPPPPPAKPKRCFLARANGDCMIEKK